MIRLLKIIIFTLTFLSGLYLGIMIKEEPVAPSNNRKFELFSDIKLFQFEGKNLTSAQLQLNKVLLEIREKVIGDFYNEIKVFFDPNYSEIETYTCGVALKCNVVQNTDKIFSCRIDTTQYHYGANGCLSNVIGVNYTIKEGKIRKIEFAELFNSEIEKFTFLKNTLAKLKILQDGKWVFMNTRELDDNDLLRFEKQLQFIVTEDKIKIMFPPYTIACGACGILETEGDRPKK